MIYMYDIYIHDTHTYMIYIYMISEGIATHTHFFFLPRFAASLETKTKKKHFKKIHLALDLGFPRF